MSADGNPLARHGHLSYLEIPARDPRQSATFYEQVLGWQIDRRSDDDFRFSGRDGLLIGRWVIDRAAAREPGLVPFLYVVGIDAAIGRVTAHGGQVVEALHPEGDIRLARVRDPAANLIGLWEFAGS